MENKKPKAVPKEHPPAWRSALWPHEKLIRSMSGRRYSWPEIAKHLKTEHDITISPAAVRNFLVRADTSKRRGKRPYAWKQADQPEQPVKDVSEINAKKTNPTPIDPDKWSADWEKQQIEKRNKSDDIQIY